MATADAFVLSSEEEGFGLVLAEAMALGTPIIATDCPGGVGDVLDGGKAGLLVPPDDPTALSKAMSRMCESEALRKQFVNDAQWHVARYAPDLVAERWLDFARKVGQRKREVSDA